MTFGALNNEVVGSHTRNEWLKLLEDEGHMCYWCGRPITDPDEAREAGVELKREQKATPDHIIPISRRGVDFIWNIVPSCVPCNQLRNNRLVRDFLRDRLAFHKQPVNKKKISTVVPLIRGRDSSGQIEVTGHLEVSDLGAQLIKNLAAKMPTMDHSDEWYTQRRKALAEQAVIVSTKLLEAAGQMRLPLTVPGPQPKPPRPDIAPSGQKKRDRVKVKIEPTTAREIADVLFAEPSHKLGSEDLRMGIFIDRANGRAGALILNTTNSHYAFLTVGEHVIEDADDIDCVFDVINNVCEDIRHWGEAANHEIG